MILNPNCSEFVFRIGIKKSEIPYIKKRLDDLGHQDTNLFEEFTDYLDKTDDTGYGEMMEERYAGDYERIRDELLAKRNGMTCPFCKEVVPNLKLHIRKYHREEVVLIYDELKKEEVATMKKEIILDNLN